MSEGPDPRDTDTVGGRSAPAEGAAPDAAPADAPTGEAAQAGEAEGKPKKKRRRLRRKKKGGAEAGGAASEGDGDKREASLPFLRFFEGEHAFAKRHAFAVGEVVAGRVTRVEDGAVLVDLFGKATAVVDVNEPRAIPAVPGEPPETGTEVAAEAPEGEAAPTPAEARPTTEAGELPTASPAALEPTPTTEAGEAAPAEPPAPASATEAAPPTGTETQAAPAPEAPAPEPEPAAPPPPPPNPGEIFRGRIGAVSESGHVAIVNRIVDRAAAEARLESAREDRRRVEGLVFGFNRGGFDVLVEGIRAFCPASGMSLGPIEDPEALVGRKLEFTVPPKKGGAHGIVVSRKNILERELRKARKARLKSLSPGEVLEGRVTQVREFGVFVDIGDGLEGLVHQSELSWKRGARPADVAKPGDTVKVQVLETKADSKKDRQARVSLSIRALLPDPWQEHEDVLKEGAARKGKVVGTTEFGAFVELAPGIEGLVHVSELGKDLEHASQAVREGEELDVVVERVDRKQRRISLSRLTAAELEAVEKGTLDLSQRPKSLEPGSHVVVVIEKVEHHGIQVRVRGVLGRRGRGYLPNRELGSMQGEGKRSLQPGAEVEVKIVGTDRDGGLRVSIKGREIDEERRAAREYRKEASKQGLGTFGDLLRRKLQKVQGSGEGS